MFKVETSVATASPFEISLSFWAFLVAFGTGVIFLPAEKELELAVYFVLAKFEPFA